jgi:hypothetical protein
MVVVVVMHRRQRELLILFVIKIVTMKIVIRTVVEVSVFEMLEVMLVLDKVHLVVQVVEHFELEMMEILVVSFT